MDSISVSKSEYAPKRVDYVSPIKPKEAGFMDAKNATFQHETSNLSDFGLKNVQRSTPIRPLNSNVFKVVYLFFTFI